MLLGHSNLEVFVALENLSCFELYMKLFLLNFVTKCELIHLVLLSNLSLLLLNWGKTLFIYFIELQEMIEIEFDVDFKCDLEEGM